MFASTLGAAETRGRGAEESRDGFLPCGLFLQKRNARVGQGPVGGRGRRRGLGGGGSSASGFWGQGQALLNGRAPAWSWKGQAEGRLGEAALGSTPICGLRGGRGCPGFFPARSCLRRAPQHSCAVSYRIPLFWVRGISVLVSPPGWVSWKPARSKQNASSRGLPPTASLPWPLSFL